MIVYVTGLSLRGIGWIAANHGEIVRSCPKVTLPVGVAGAFGALEQGGQRDRVGRVDDLAEQGQGAAAGEGALAVVPGLALGQALGVSGAADVDAVADADHAFGLARVGEFDGRADHLASDVGGGHALLAEPEHADALGQVDAGALVGHHGGLGEAHAQAGLQHGLEHAARALGRGLGGKRAGDHSAGDRDGHDHLLHDGEACQT
ncbi:hypothetical protein AB0K48_01825 [Nonomuraea sp. NPDC055795]